jgi:hypothetical protein
MRARKISIHDLNGVSEENIVWCRLEFFRTLQIACLFFLRSHSSSILVHELSVRLSLTSHTNTRPQRRRRRYGNQHQERRPFCHWYRSSANRSGQTQSWAF